MSKRDAEDVGVDEDDRFSYLRLDDAKTKMGPPGDAKWFERQGELMARQFGSEEIGVLVPWAPDTTVGMATQTDMKSLLNFIQTRFEQGQPVTTKGSRDVKKLAVKSLKGMKAKMVRDLVRGWRKDGVLDLMRSFYKGERKSGVGLTEKGGNCWKGINMTVTPKDAKSPKWTSRVDAASPSYPP